MKVAFIAFRAKISQFALLSFASHPTEISERTKTVPMVSKSIHRYLDEILFSSRKAYANDSCRF